MDTTNVLTPTTWSGVYEALFEDTYNPRTERYKSRYAFRGVSTNGYPMETSLMRLGGEYEKVEAHLLRQFKKYAYRYIQEKHNQWHWLSVAQHYGLPTRLLDWTYSPDVALHFATANTGSYDKDGAIWKVNYKKIHERLPPIYHGIVEDRQTWILTVELLEEMFNSLEQLDAAGHTRGDFFLFFEPPSIDQRLFNQFAYFSIGSRPNLAIDTWLLGHPDAWFKVVIPKELKWEIRDKLDQMNMSERTLFPDLNGLAQWLKRYYLPTGSAAKKVTSAQPPATPPAMLSVTGKPKPKPKPKLLPAAPATKRASTRQNGSTVTKGRISK